jgi:hypothetical protein
MTSSVTDLKSEHKVTKTTVTYEGSALFGNYDCVSDLDTVGSVDRNLINLDTNSNSERSKLPTTKGRRNFMFCGTVFFWRAGALSCSL